MGRIPIVGGSQLAFLNTPVTWSFTTTAFGGLWISPTTWRTPSDINRTWRISVCFGSMNLLNPGQISMSIKANASTLQTASVQHPGAISPGIPTDVGVTNVWCGLLAPNSTITAELTQYPSPPIIESCTICIQELPTQI